MSDLHEFEADFLRRVIAARREGQQVFYKDKFARKILVDSPTKQIVGDLERRGLVQIVTDSLRGSWYDIVLITDKGYSALAEHIADERTARAEQMKYCDDLREVVESLLTLLHDQAQRIAELELRA